MLYVGIGIAVLLAGFVLFVALAPALERSRAEVAQYIDDFIDESGGDWDWDDFTSIQIRDPYLDSIRKRCCAIHDNNPPEVEGEWCSSDGRESLREILAELTVDAG